MLELAEIINGAAESPLSTMFYKQYKGWQKRDGGGKIKRSHILQLQCRQAHRRSFMVIVVHTAHLLNNCAHFKNLSAENCFELVLKHRLCMVCISS